MSDYVKTEWKTGDIITAEKLNKIEGGIYDAPVPTGKITITENGEDIDVSEYALADVAVEGGDSDLSTADVTFNRLTPNPDGGGGWSDICSIDDIYDSLIWASDFDSLNSNPVTVVLYKGHALGSAMGMNLAVSGNATWNSDTGELDITGDCTITYTPSQDN